MIRAGAGAAKKQRGKVAHADDGAHGHGAEGRDGRRHHPSVSGNASTVEQSLGGDSSTTGKDEEDREDGRPLKVDMTSRDWWWLRLDDPSFSREGYWWSIAILLLITLSCTAFVVETIPSMCCGRYDDVWENIEVVCVMAFTVEYIARIVVCPVWACGDASSMFNWSTHVTARDTFMQELFARCRFFWRPLNLVDCAAILPFYITLASDSGAGGTQFLRVIRLARVFRLFKLSKYSEGMHLLSSTMVRSWRALGMLFFFMVISVIVFSSIMYFVERGHYFYCTPEAVALGKCEANEVAVRTEGLGLELCDDWANDGANQVAAKRLSCCYKEAWYAIPPSDVNGDGCADRSKFESIPATAWWCVVTMTTVGYGDVVPLTTGGKLVAMVTMLGGILILALPITVIGSNFNIEYEKSEEEKKHRRELDDKASLKSSKNGAAAKPPGVINPGASTESVPAAPTVPLASTPARDLAGPPPVRETSEQIRGSFAQELSTSQSHLLEQVKQILEQQREEVIKKADRMIQLHVREIAHQVVARSLGSHNGSRTESGNTGTGKEGTPVASSPSAPASSGEPQQPL
uniref:Ion transport domain-containing protein n=1 Tax=Hemiselmis tepida TaxID=464990 RepID=A0A7S0VUQ9_9CRYP|mmetsp:Transcript_20013/g.50643  ORF Transcript_20013/g.50643 Transcript_20013/m.50643 type:complete len:576 (+) Transcript_20013:74-1801(+)